MHKTEAGTALCALFSDEPFGIVDLNRIGIIIECIIALLHYKGSDYRKRRQSLYSSALFETLFLLFHRGCGRALRVFFNSCHCLFVDIGMAHVITSFRDVE